MNEFDEFDEIISMLTKLIPDGTNQESIIDGVTYKFSKDKGEIKIEINETFDKTKELVSNYKENIKALDDNLFLEAVEELRSKIDLKEFNELLDLENFNKEQADKVEEMISISSDVICSHMQHKIQDLIELYEKF